MSDSLRSHRRQPTRLLRPWDSPGKNTGGGCHVILQYRKVKSESEVAQSCLTLRDPMDCSLPGSSVQGIFQARVLEWVAFSRTSPKCWWGCGKTGFFICCWWDSKMVQPFWKTVWQFLTKLNMYLLYHPAIALLGIYLRAMKVYVHAHLHMGSTSGKEPAYQCRRH